MKLSAKIRSEKGKESAKRFRSQGFIPAILYGEKQESLPLVVNGKELASLLSKHRGTSLIVDLEIDGEKKMKQAALVKEIQKHKTRDKFLHIDLMRIVMDEEIKAVIPVVAKGESEGAKQGGVLQILLHEVNIEALPKNIPEYIEVDISNLQIGDSLHLENLPKIEGVNYLDDPESVLLTIVPPIKVEEKVEVVEEVPAEEAVAEKVAGEKKEEPIERKKEEKESGQESK